MSEMNEVVRLAVDAYHGNVNKFSTSESMDTLRQALIEANNGSTTLNYKNIRDGKCNGLFALIEEILSRTIVEGLQGDEAFMKLVEFRNVALGDKNLFEIEDADLFTVADTAEGTQGIRRQRLGGYTQVSIPTVFKTIRIYEELNRVLAGQVDFNFFIGKCAESMKKKILEDIWNLWNKATEDDFGGPAYYHTAAGNYDEDVLLDIIGHVEAVSGKPAMIFGTKKALRKLAPSIVGEAAMTDLYMMGYYGNFYGTPVVAMPQRHQVGSTSFIFPDNRITVLATDKKPIKCVYEGDSTVILGDPANNRDLTQEYIYGERYGVGFVSAGNTGFGRYEFTESN